jgi:hypothetical protein
MREERQERGDGDGMVGRRLIHLKGRGISGLYGCTPPDGWARVRASRRIGNISAHLRVGVAYL